MLCGKSRYFTSVAVVAFIFAAAAQAQQTVWLASLDIGKTEQGWGTPHKDQSVEGHQLSIAGQKFERGLGTHSVSTLCIDLRGGTKSFSAMVGVDDEINGAAGSVEFRVIGDGKVLWKSGVMKAGEAAKKCDVDLTGVKTLVLQVTDADDGMNWDHADWADAKFEVTGARPRTVDAPHEPAVILTPKAPATPRINGARVYGARPGHPFLFTIAATGERPMTFAAENLPAGLALDRQSGIISGAIAQRGETVVTLRAENALGKAERQLKIVCGDRIALTPPLGWNSWNCFAGAVDDAKVRSAADAMVKAGLINHGWSYINIDDCWEIKPDSDDPKLKGEARDANGMINSNRKFPDMKALTDYIHAKGLKAGLYSSPGPLTCAGFTASYKFEDKDAQRWAEWGFDYIKYDWCSYGEVVKGQQQTREVLTKPYEVLRASLDKVNRDIVYSLCQYGMGNVWEWGDKVGGNCWRTTGDISDSWGSMSGIGFSQAGHEKFAGPGHWNDPDMLVVGRLGWGSLRPTRLTPNEQYTHISLWCLLCSPLLIGCDMSQLDEFTLSLLTNDEVLEVNQDPLGKQAGRVAKTGELEVWAKDMEDGSKAVGLFNRGEGETPVKVQFSELGITGKQTVRDLWRQKDVGEFENEFSATVGRHGVVLVRIRAAK